MIRFLWNYGFLIIVCPIILFWMKMKVHKWLINDKKQREHEIKEWEIRENSHSNKVLLNSNPELYTECRTLFNHLMKDGKMSRREILFLRSAINRLLGDNVLQHYKTFKFDSEAHEIYVKLKNQYLEKEDYQYVLDYLKECERITKEEVV